MGGHGKHIMALACNDTLLVYTCLCVAYENSQSERATGNAEASFSSACLSVSHLVFYCTPLAALTAEIL